MSRSARGPRPKLRFGAGLTDDCETRLVAAQAGAEWAIASLYRELHPRLLRYVSTREHGAAEDIVAEVWLAVAAGLHRFVGNEQQFRGGVFSIARRRLADYRRTTVRRKTTSVPDEQLEGPGRHDAEDLGLERFGTRWAVSLVVSVLPPDQAEVVLLRVLADLDVGQVAELLGKRPGTIRVLQHRALRRLQAVMADERVTARAAQTILQGWHG